MKRLFVVAMFFAALVRVGRADEGKFTSTISPEELAALGLSGLTPAQLARLNALVEDYKSGALATARRATDEALAAKRAAEAQVARAEATAAAARADATKAEAARAEAARAEAAKIEAARAEAAKPAPSGGIFAKAKGLLKPGASSPETVAVESSLPGKFLGWSPHQIFTLANGQRFQEANGLSYYHPAMQNPRVQIVPAAMAGYWLRFPELDVQVRVNLLEGN